MSTLAVNSIIPANAGSEDYFLARAWVNFNGTGTVAIRADGNVSSITDHATGAYTVSFSNALDDANYSASSLSGRGTLGTAAYVPVGPWLADPTTSEFRIQCYNASAAIVDAPYVSAGFTR